MTASHAIRSALVPALRLGCCVFILAAGISKHGVAAPAADGLADMAGLADATLGISQFTADGAQCGLQADRVSAPARRAVADAGITLHDGSINRIAISAVTARVGTDQCATAVLMGVYAKESFFSAAAGWVQSGYVVLWQRSVMVATPVNQHAAAVTEASRRLTEQMLVDWRTQNRPAAPAAAPADGGQPRSGDKVAVQAAPARSKATP